MEVIDIKKILIVEDDLSLSNGIAIALKDNELSFSQVQDLNSARIQIKDTNFDLIILDINLPDGNGLGFLQELRRNSTVPVIILTAKDMETDVVTGLELGADDYITKPFSLMILRARVQTQLRKVDSITAGQIQLDDFKFDFVKMEFSKKMLLLSLARLSKNCYAFYLKIEVIH